MHVQLNVMQMLKLVQQQLLLVYVMMDIIELVILHVLNVQLMLQLVHLLELQLVMMDISNQQMLQLVMHVLLELKLVQQLELLQ